MVVHARVLLLASSLSAIVGLGFAGHGAYLYAKAVVAQRLLGLAWTRALNSGVPVRAWPWADSRPIARIWLPKSKPIVILSNADGSSLAFAPGHLPGSAQPGYPGHSVISAHRDTHFRALQRVKRGDHLRVQRTDGKVVNYEVVSTEIMHTDRQRLQHIETDESWITLVTCYPFAAVRPGGPWRFLLHARADSTIRGHGATGAGRQNPRSFVGF